MNLNEVKIINAETAKNMLVCLPIGKKIHFLFDRVAPKCEHCNKSSKSWIGKTNCPRCGAELSASKFAYAKVNTIDEKSREGNSVYIKTALSCGRFVYFDIDAKEFRQCYFDKIKKILIENLTWYVV